jgi:hypothetical protein
MASLPIVHSPVAALRSTYASRYSTWVSGTRAAVAAEQTRSAATRAVGRYQRASSRSRGLGCKRPAFYVTKSTIPSRPPCAADLTATRHHRRAGL